VKCFANGIVGKRIKLAAEWFFRTQFATLITKMWTVGFNANGVQTFLLESRQGDFQRWVARFDVTTLLAFCTLIKKHVPSLRAIQK
jgi:hypothetical protein